MRSGAAVSAGFTRSVVLAACVATVTGVACRSERKEETAPVTTPPPTPAHIPAAPVKPVAAPVEAPAAVVMSPDVAAAVAAADALVAEESKALGALVKALDGLEAVSAKANTPESEARWELAFGKLLDRTMDAIGAAGEPPPEGKGVVAKYERILMYSEPAARHYVDEDHLWTIADKFIATTSGDELAWFAATMPAAGECEGDTACYLERSLNGEARYLKTLPRGKHAFAALLDVEGVVPNSDQEFDQAAEGGEDAVKSMREKLAEIRGAVAKTEDGTKKTAVLATIDAADARLAKLTK